MTGLNPVPSRELAGWSPGEASGTPHVAVKCADMWKNTGGEGGLLDSD